MDKKLIFKVWFAPGDVLVAMNAIKDFAIQNPKIEIAVLTPYPEITFNNPFLNQELLHKDDIQIIDLTYANALLECKSVGIHYSQGYYDCLKDIYNYEVIQSSIYPEIYLTEEEKNKEKLFDYFDLDKNKKYWLINTGFKVDMPLKSWIPVYWKRTILELISLGFNLIQVGSINHIHEIYDNSINFVGKTECLRDFIKLCYISEGSIGPVSLHMHIMAAFNKKCVVIAGGRENPRWEYYPGHIYLNTVGLLDCCKNDGCWYKQRYECEKINESTKYPFCMSLITPDEVIKNFLKLNYFRS